MPAWGAVSRRQLIAVLRRLEFASPYSGGKHEFPANEFARYAKHGVVLLRLSFLR